MEESQQIAELLAEADAYGRKEKVIELVSELKNEPGFNELSLIKLYETSYEIEVNLHERINQYIK